MAPSRSKDSKHNRTGRYSKRNSIRVEHEVKAEEAIDGLADPSNGENENVGISTNNKRTKVMDSKITKTPPIRKQNSRKSERKGKKVPQKLGSRRYSLRSTPEGVGVHQSLSKEVKEKPSVPVSLTVNDKIKPSIHVEQEIKAEDAIDVLAGTVNGDSENMGMSNNNIKRTKRPPPDELCSPITRTEVEDLKVMNTPPVRKQSSIKSERKGKEGSQKMGSKRYPQRSNHEVVRVLRSMSKEKNEKSSVPGSSTVNVEIKPKKKKRKKKGKDAPNNEFALIRKRVRYMLTRMNYEQNLIDAYASEGWKGLSSDKLRPEKELERAKSEILRCKFRIREAFQQLDSLLSEGRFQESLFDSDGEIDSENIFCVKCGSKDLSLDNDIILCDGICDRGFHQKCLNPPLLTEQIPLGDEGWLCPACDCKIDCLELLDDSQGIDLSIEDTWEKVFPEAAVIANGDNQCNNFNFPSDDSEDDDYNPDIPAVDAEDERGDSSSDESDSTSLSGESEPLNNNVNFDISAFPSDDSEDDDFDPGRPDPNKDVEKEVSTSDESDFTSDSDDFCAELSKNANDVQIASLSDNKQVDNCDKEINFEDRPVIDSSVSGKQQLEPLDFKKLNDLNYPSDDSEDDDYNPDIPAADAQGEKGESSSGESDSTSMSEESAPLNDKVNFDISALPSDDSGDDDFDLDRPDPDKNVEKEGSTSDESDFSCDSDDFCAELSKNANDVPMTSEIDNCDKERNFEAIALNHSVSGKRRRKPLDFKKLKDEACSKVPSDSSHDDDFSDNVAAKKVRKNNSEPAPAVTPKAEASSTDNGRRTRSSMKNSKKPKGRDTVEKPDIDLSHASQTNGIDNRTPDKDSAAVSAGNKGTSSRRMLGQSVVQKLLDYFKEDQYPNRETKERFAEEFGIPVKKVDKWFENMRRSMRVSAKGAERLGVSVKSSPKESKHSQTPIFVKAADLPGISMDDCAKETKHPVPKTERLEVSVNSSPNESKLLHTPTSAKTADLPGISMDDCAKETKHPEPKTYNETSGTKNQRRKSYPNSQTTKKLTTYFPRENKHLKTPTSAKDADLPGTNVNASAEENKHKEAQILADAADQPKTPMDGCAKETKHPGLKNDDETPLSRSRRRNSYPNRQTAKNLASSSAKVETLNDERSPQNGTGNGIDHQSEVKVAVDRDRQKAVARELRELRRRINRI